VEGTVRIFDKWVRTEEPLPDWGQLPLTECLQGWARELRHALTESHDKQAWALVGHGAIIAHDDTERARHIFRRIAADAGMRFGEVPLTSVLGFPVDGMDALFVFGPMIVYLEPGAWMHGNVSEVAEKQATGGTSGPTPEVFRSHLLRSLNAFDPDSPVIFVTAATRMTDVAEELRAANAMDRRFAVAKPPAEFRANEFIDFVGRELCASSITGELSKVGRLLNDHVSDRTRGLAVLAMQRLAAREARTLEYVDLLGFSLRGTVESDSKVVESDSAIRQVAYHEAGHALAAMLDSHGQNVPEYATIVACNEFGGVVVESSNFVCAREEFATYRDFRHSIRISLAGRAAEQILVGAEGVSSSCAADLEHASRRASEAFAIYGFAPDMGDDQNAALNLAVVFGDPSHSEYQHIETLVRKFLATEYKAVLAMLEAQRALLDTIANLLMSSPAVEQSALAAIYASHHPSDHES